MPAHDRAWTPTSPGQTAIAYALAGLLMLNMTVLVLLVSGELPLSGGTEATAFAQPAGHTPASPFNAVAEPGDDTSTVAEATAPSSTASPAIQRVGDQPVTLPALRDEPTLPVVEASAATAQKTDTPRRSPEDVPAEPDEPLEFFGIPVK